MKKLIDFLEEQGQKEELKSLKDSPDERKFVKASAYVSDSAKIDWIIGLLDDIYEVEEKGEYAFLVKKHEN